MDIIGQVPAETTTYLIAGYIVIFGAMILYLMSLIIRWRKLQIDLRILEKIEKEKV